MDTILSVYDAIKLCSIISFLTGLPCHMDTVINVVPNADISKTHKITFFSIISKISIFASQNFVRIYLGVYGTIQYKKLELFR